MRNKFDEELSLLNTELIEMGSLIENSIENAVEALIKKNEEMAKQSLQVEDEINKKERDIEARCLKLLLHQQPVAKDLRIISSALKMITDMERIGDQAYDIAEITIRLTNKYDVDKLDHICAMAKATIFMVKESIEAFVARDLNKASEVIDYDDKVDALFDDVRNDLIRLIRVNKDLDEEIIDILMIAKYFERIGDHAQNIAEWVVFSITGEH